MSAGQDILRVLLSEGVRVQRRADGSLALIPPERVTSAIIQLAKDAKPEIAAALDHLPAPGRCPICGDPTGWPEKTQLHCVTCGLIACERLDGAHDISKRRNVMPIELQCKTCGAAFTPTRAEIMAGPAVYRSCPSCRPQPTGDHLERPIAAKA